MATVDDLRAALRSAESAQSTGVTVQQLQAALNQTDESNQTRPFQQTITEEQQLRLQELRGARLQRDRDRQLALGERFGVESPPESIGREELLLQQGFEVGGPALRLARLRAGFASNPIPAITEGLLEAFPDSTPEQLNLRYEQRVPTDELEREIDDATLSAQAQTDRELRERAANGEEITQEVRNKVTGRNLQTALANLPGLELVYDDPVTGRATVANPAQGDIGDLAELAGPALPFGGELVGAGTGAVFGAPGNAPGIVAGAAVGGGVGRGAGEAARLGIGRVLGVEPEEADFIDPVLSETGLGAFNSALGGTINALVARSIAKRVAGGQFGLEAARFGNFLDPVTFSQNQKALERFNQLAREKGIQALPKPTFGQLTGNKEVLDFERSLASSQGPLNRAKIENARLLDDVATAFNPKSGEIKRQDVGRLISRIASEIDKRISSREAELGRAISESEAREVSSQVGNILQADFRTDNALAADSLRQAALDAENTIFRERFGQQFRNIAQRSQGILGEAENLRQEALNIGREQSEEIFGLSGQGGLAQQAEAATRPSTLIDDQGEIIVDFPEVKLDAFLRDTSNLKELKRKVDAGQVNDKDSRTLARFIASAERDTENILRQAGREDILEDLLATRANFGQAKQLSQKAFGKLLSRDSSGNFRVDDADVFQRVVLNPSSATGIKSMLIDSGQESQLALIREGIRDVYARRFLPEGAQPNQLDKAAAQNWFNQNERALSVYFSPKELSEFKSPAILARKEKENRKKMELAQKKMRKWFGADLAETRDNPQKFMDTVFSKGTPQRMQQIKRILPSDQWSIFKDLYRNDLLAKIRSDSSSDGFNLNKLFSQTGQSNSASTRELIGRQTAEQILGKKEIRDLKSYGEALQILRQQGSRIVQDDTVSRRLRNVVRFFVKPLSVMSRRANALINEGQNNIETRMERALADPVKLKKMIQAVNEFKKDKISPAAATAFVDVLGSDVFDDLSAIEEEINQE